MRTKKLSPRTLTTILFDCLAKLVRDFREKKRQSASQPASQPVSISCSKCQNGEEENGNSAVSFWKRRGEENCKNASSSSWVFSHCMHVVAVVYPTVWKGADVNLSGSKKMVSIHAALQSYLDFLWRREGFRREISELILVAS